MGGHASHGHTSDLAFKKRGYGEETVVLDSVVIGDFDSRNYHKVKRPWKVPFFRTILCHSLSVRKRFNWDKLLIIKHLSGKGWVFPDKTEVYVAQGLLLVSVLVSLWVSLWVSGITPAKKVENLRLSYASPELRIDAFSAIPYFRF